MNRKTKFAALGLTLVLSSMMLVATIATVSATGSAWESHYATCILQETLDMQPGNKWTNLGNIYSTQGGGKYASVAGNGENDIQYSYKVELYFSGFTLGGAGWTVTGIVFKLGGYMVNAWDRTSTVRDYSIQIKVSDSFGLWATSSKSPQGTWPTSYTIRSYGSSSDKWGLDSWFTPGRTPVNFIILYEAKFTDGAWVPAALYANGAEITVYYYQP